ncbi:potassium channel family protein [Aeropyrum pernix]|nr:hypothetical protein [Aeropyrum pernix]
MGEDRRRGGIVGLLSEARRLTSIMIDLSIYSVAFGDRLAALETLMLEDDVDEIIREAVGLLSLAVRGPGHTGLAKGIVELAAAFDRASDAAGDLAQLVLRGYPPHKYVTAAAICCGEVVAALKAERPLDRLDIVDVLILRRGGRALLSPEDFSIREGDVLIVRGSLEALLEAAESLGAKPPKPPADVETLLADDTARGVARAKVLARAGFDASLYSLLAGDAGLARTVLDMEEMLDNDILSLMEDIVAQGLTGPETLTLILFLRSLEDFSDAAARAAGLVETELPGRVVEGTIGDPWESYLALDYMGERRRLSELGLDEEGLVIVAAKVGGKWIIPFLEDPEIGRGDTVLAKIYSGQADTLKELVEARGFVVKGRSLEGRP